jgi:hypothetical protein
MARPKKGIDVVGGPIPTEQATRESREIFIPIATHEEGKYLPVSLPVDYEKVVKEIQSQLKDIKKDLEDLKAAVEKMDRNGLRMRPAF